MSWALSQKLGTWVANCFVGVALLSPGGYVCLLLKVPWIVSPFDEIDFTSPALTSLRKAGLKGTFTRGSLEDGWNSRTVSQLSAISTSTNHRKPRVRWGGGPLRAALACLVRRGRGDPPATLVPR